VKSAEKRVRTNEKRRLRNRTVKQGLKTSLKRAETAIEAAGAQAVKEVTDTMSCIGKSRRKGVINRNRAARLQSRIQRRFNKKQQQAPAAS
jgi:small subunit ribosomal protein S20